MCLIERYSIVYQCDIYWFLPKDFRIFRHFKYVIIHKVLYSIPVCIGIVLYSQYTIEKRVKNE